jgi:hypothetical protein
MVDRCSTGKVREYGNIEQGTRNNEYRITIGEVSEVDLNPVFVTRHSSPVIRHSTFLVPCSIFFIFRE